MLSTALVVQRPTDLPDDLRVIRNELFLYEYCSTPTGAKRVDGYALVVFGDPHRITQEHRDQLAARGWHHFKGRNAGTFKKRLAVRFEGPQ